MPGPDPEAAATPMDPSSCVWSSAALALMVALLGFTYGGFSSLQPSTYPGTMLDSFSVSDSIANKVFITFLSFACVGTYMLGVFLINQALKTLLALLILSLFLLENTHPIKILLTFSFFSCLLHSEAPFSMFGATANSIATFPAIHPPPSLQIFLSSAVHLSPEAAYSAVFLNSRLRFLLPC